MAGKAFELWDGSIELGFYELLESASVLPIKCLPFNGDMYAMDGSGLQWRPRHQVYVRKIAAEDIVAEDLQKAGDR